MTKLKNKQTIGLGSVYLHENINDINLKFLVNSGLTVHPDLLMKKGVSWYDEIHRILPINCKLLLNAMDYNLIAENGLVPTHEKYFFAFERNIFKEEWIEIDFLKGLYEVNNVFFMAMQVALGMGFDKIYLIGVDFDHMKYYFSGGFENFYKRNKSVIYSQGKDLSERVSFSQLLENYSWQWKVLDKIKNYADFRDIQIINLSDSSLLDMFPVDNFDDVVV